MIPVRVRKSRAIAVSFVALAALIALVMLPSATAFGKSNVNTSAVLSGYAIRTGQSVTVAIIVTGQHGTPTGKVNFQVSRAEFPNHHWVNFQTNVSLSHGKAKSKRYTPNHSGHWDFRAIYLGSSVYNAKISRELELSVLDLTVTDTALEESEIELGDSVTDTATVTGGSATPTGTVDFQVRQDIVDFPAPETHTAWVTYSADVPLSSGTATSDPYFPLTAGEYDFRALYSGDVTHAASQSSDEGEDLTVDRADSTTTTELSCDEELGAYPPSQCEITLGESIYDTATVTGLGGPYPIPTGDVDFQVSDDDGVTWTTYDEDEPLVNGSATSITIFPFHAGEFLFRAIYEGDSNYLPSQSGSKDEPLTVNKADTTTVTKLHLVCEDDHTVDAPAKGRIGVAMSRGRFAEVISLGESVTDTACVFGLDDPFPTPTGTVDFQVSADDGSTWITYDSDEPLIDGKATSTPFAPQNVGEYLFQAVYSGDDNYNGSQSDPCDERLIVEEIKSVTTTNLSDIEITLGDGPVFDTATVTGLGDGFPKPTGTVDFQISLDGGNTWLKFDVGEPLNDGTAQSEDYTPLQAGTIYFRALYHGDSNYSPSVSGNEEEPLLVNGAPSTTATQLSTSQITLGDSVTDTATVTGLGNPFPAPTGTVDFQVSADFATTWTTFDTETLSGGVATSTSYTPLAAGIYVFRAVYNGDANYNSSTSGDFDEVLYVLPAESTTTTQLSSTLITLGDSVTDTATVTGLGGPFPIPTVGIIFQYSTDFATTWTTFDEQFLVAGSATSIPYTPLLPGFVEFRAIYTGDSNYNGSTSGDFDEVLIVQPANSTTTTQLSPNPISLGDSVTDTVAVTGLGGSFPIPTGGVSFQASSDGGASWVQYDVESLSGGYATATPYTPVTAGTYYFRALYGGDSNYNPSASGDLDEPLTIDRVNSTTSTQFFTSQFTLGDSVTDLAEVTGLGGPFPVPTGTVDFQASADFATTWTTFDTETLSGGFATSAPYTPLTAGTYVLRAVYGGDSTYNGSTSGDFDEVLTVLPANSTTTTELTSAQIPLGDSVTDTATVTGLGGPFPVPTGGITFQYSTDFAGTWTTYDEEFLVGNSATSTPYTPLFTGFVEFRAIYTGDSNYNPSQTGDFDEFVIVQPVDSTTTTQLLSSEITLGDSVTDAVTVNGLGGSFPIPTGGIEFQASDDGGATWVQYDVESLSGGTATATPYTPVTAGTYYFRALYGGDSNYNPSQSGDLDEPLTVDQASSVTTTLVSEGVGVVSDVYSDEITVTGLGGLFPVPTGTVDWETSFEGGAFTFVATLPLVNGSANTGLFTFGSPGAWRLRAIYSGDSNYLPSQSGDDDEPVTVLDVQ